MLEVDNGGRRLSSTTSGGRLRHSRSSERACLARDAWQGTGSSRVCPRVVSCCRSRQAAPGSMALAEQRSSILEPSDDRGLSGRVACGPRGGGETVNRPFLFGEPGDGRRPGLLKAGSPSREAPGKTGLVAVTARFARAVIAVTGRQRSGRVAPERAEQAHRWLPGPPKRGGCVKQPPQRNAWKRSVPLAARSSGARL